jgi:hypothetical protein
MKWFNGWRYWVVLAGILVLPYAVKAMLPTGPRVVESFHSKDGKFHYVSVSVPVHHKD